MARAQRDSITLQDGRRLAWHEFGAPDGVPCVYTPGTPASGLAGGLYHAPAREADVRWISVDKPGCGHSDRDPHRSLPGYAADIAELLDHLGFERVVAAGESGGGPHTLAVAHCIPDRLHATVVVAGLGPAQDPSVRAGMKRDNRVLITLAQRAPWLLRLQMRMLARQVRTRPQRWAESMRGRLPDPDQRAWPLVAHLLVPAAREALQDGGRSAADELVMFTRPWGFDLADVATPVHLWHGTEDANVPIAVAEAMRDALPHVDTRFVDGEGHSLGALVRDDLAALVRDVTP
ncbi:alpha/beta fold hydrolase [Allosaccharopolyspora coralli]|nr:alpha/beta hydrolase [Allosaccharopolyspora coralli]